MRTVDGEERALLAALRDMWEIGDPMPPDLPDRVLFALELENLPYELLRIRPMAEPVGARGDERTDTVTFASDSLTVMLALSGLALPSRALDGWIAPGAALRVELRPESGVLSARADRHGRFAFTKVPPGLAQLVIHPTEGAGVHLERCVVAPAIRL